MHRARDRALAALVALVVAACGGAGAPGPAPASPTAVVSERTVAFADAGATAHGGRADGPAVGAERTATGLRITAYQGEQRTGGYAIRIERITRVGTELRVHARLSEPPPGSFNTMALTSPSHTVTVEESADVVVLYDHAGTELARVSVP